MRGSECRTDTFQQLCTGLRVLAELWTVIQVLWEICGHKGLKHTADFTKICVAWFIFLFNSQSAGCAGPQVPQICADEIPRQGTSSSHPLQFLCVPPRGCDQAAFWNIFFFFGKNFEKNFLKETGCQGARRVAFQNPDISLISFIYLPQNQNTTSVW